jgi:hypothetical protein
MQVRLNLKIKIYSIKLSTASDNQGIYWVILIGEGQSYIFFVEYFIVNTTLLQKCS